uniref:Adenosine 3'-phospho 5'-phosphosulfate transporter 1 n=1 Tax=Anser brachyrhynchus TaxID=132585 RepID=A0A8B9CPA5_9AVES
MAAGEAFPPALQDAWGDFWLFRFFVNAAGYASIVVPGFLLIQYFKRRNYLETGRGICFPVIKSCVFGSEVKSVHPDDGSLPPRAEPTESSTARQVLKLLFCAAGLQASYLTWGVLQERVMTRTYGATETDPGEKFKDSQFLVFMNRILAFTVAGLYCALTKQPRHGAPMYKYSFASLSNILSSWCQYEALKYISFPTQVLAKASKVIPVMMMGKLVSRKSYEYWEYLTAALISVGVSMFLLSSAPNRHASTVTTFSGVVLLAGRGCSQGALGVPPLLLLAPGIPLVPLRSPAHQHPAQHALQLLQALLDLEGRRCWVARQDPGPQGPLPLARLRAHHPLYPPGTVPAGFPWDAEGGSPVLALRRLPWRSGSAPPTPAAAPPPPAPQTPSACPRSSFPAPHTESPGSRGCSGFRRRSEPACLPSRS